MSIQRTALLNFVQQISKEKGLHPLVIKDAIEQAVVSTSKKNLSHFSDAKAHLDMETGELTILVKKRIVEKVQDWRCEIAVKEAQKSDPDIKVGDEIDSPIPASDFGRVAAQSARQIIMQKLRDAEREKIFDEYRDRAGQIVTGVVQRFERRDAILNVGDTEGVLPFDEQPVGVRYKFGDRIKCLIQRVEMTTRGPAIRLSRSTPDLVEKLFTLEVPEIGDGIVQIVAIAREAGVRTKLAVTSRNPDVDPVGACVGMKGSRVQMIVREFENEKIDIVPWSANPTTFITAALNPAQIMRVDLDMENKSAMVIVPQDNLSLAIGKRGQNARLASRLTGWRLDIKCAEDLAEAEAREEAREYYLRDFLDQLEISPEAREFLARSARYDSVEKLAAADPLDIAILVGAPQEQADMICEEAAGYLEALKAMQADQDGTGSQSDGDGATGAVGEDDESGDSAESETTSETLSDDEPPLDAEMNSPSAEEEEVLSTDEEDEDQAEEEDVLSTDEEDEEKDSVE